jgi:ABC-type multidrug transport system ATPase subunit
MLHVSGLEKAFAGHPILRRVDLAVHATEAVALVGANGSGKTTTLRSIVGLTLPDRGSIRVGGIDVRRQPREARRLMSYMPQRPVFPDTLTVREILNTVAQLRAISAHRVDEELAACGLDAIADHRVAELSGGERQRVALASALLPAVKLYLFDEPSASLDVAATALLVGRVTALRAQGCAVLFTTHVTHDLDALATRVERISEGRCPTAPIVRGDERVLVDDGPRVRADVSHDRLCRPFAGA